MIKLVLTVISGGLAAWMGVSFVSRADMSPMAGPVVVPQHGDSHRLGALRAGQIELPRWDRESSSDMCPLLGGLALVD